MKKHILFLVTILICLQNVFAQYVEIPDTYLNTFLIQSFPSCFDENEFLDTTCSDVVNLKKLSLQSVGISNYEGIQYFKKLEELDISKNYLTRVGLLPKSLKSLIISNNLLDSCTFGENLEFLDCSSNLLTSFQLTGNKLKHLYCGNNQLSNLPVLPDSLISLNCMSNKIDTFPNSLPSNLQFLQISYNLIQTLPNLPSGVKDILAIDNNKLRTLPNIPSGVYDLQCSKNEISYLPKLHNKLLVLNASFNKIMQMDSLPNSLISLELDHNNLKQLKPLPNNLTVLTCNDNNLAFLSKLPKSLKKLYCYNNEMFTLPKLPDSLEVLQFDRCFPSLPSSLKRLYINDTSFVKCLPNYVPNLQVKESETLLPLNLPLCNNQNNINNCYSENLPNLVGTVFYDNNLNGIFDSTETTVPKIAVKIVGKSLFALSDINGNFNLTIDTIGLTTIELQGNTYILTQNQSTYFNTPTDIKTLNIPVVLKNELNDFETHLTNYTYFRPGFNCTFQVSISHTGKTNDSCIVSFEFPQGFEFLGASLSNFVETDSNITWKLSDIKANSLQFIQIYGKIKSNVNLGTQLVFTSTVNNLGTTELITVNNSDSSKGVVTGSFDPNDKQATSNLKPSQLQNGEFIDYTIRFQNTGTDTAFTVVIKDTLSQLLKANTLEILASSHNCKTTITNNIVNFRFDNILLPDSNRNEAGSHGFVRFKVQPNSSVKEDDVIENKAYIYFDYNLPVITNTTYTSFIENVTDLFDTYISNNSNIYPNPAKDKITVVANGSEFLSIYNATGNLVHQQTIHGTQEIDINDLTSGLYLYNLGAKRGKLVIK
ncbi:MAG: T9SS type A sorting domain-containing protein [Cytophagales bacterium]